LQPLVADWAEKFLDHFLNGQTPPPRLLFYPAPMNAAFQGGRGVARETRAFPPVPALLDHANESFGLLRARAAAMIYFAPMPRPGRSG
jgi:hypothetical protein